MFTLSQSNPMAMSELDAETGLERRRNDRLQRLARLAAVSHEEERRIGKRQASDLVVCFTTRTPA